MRILVPQGIGDSVWCVTKAQALAQKHDGVIDLQVACFHENATEQRALDFLRRFSFVHSAEMYVVPRRGNDGPVLRPGPPADENGYYRYLHDGRSPDFPDIDYIMMPNSPLEKGIRLEHWLPELEINWDVMDAFQFRDEELAQAEKLKQRFGPYVVFFMASLANNTRSGHNRNGLWSVDDWLSLGKSVHQKYGVQIFVVGTTWDEDYYRACIKPKVQGLKYWRNYISQWPIAQTLAVLKGARFVVSYQSGIGIVSHYMGRPVAIFWRPRGDSISPNSYVSFDEGMASAWAKPNWQESGKFLPCIYGRHRPSDILKHAEQCGW